MPKIWSRKSEERINRIEVRDLLFYRYFHDWVEEYKVGSIADVTLSKYRITETRLKELVPKLKIENMGRQDYQKLLNDYADTHERQTVMDFHHQVKACIQDAYDEGIIERDPTRRAVIRGKMPGKKKEKFLSKAELQKLINVLPLNPEEIGIDWFILLLGKTGLRFAEALALTPEDFDFSSKKILVSKTWDYKNKGGGSFAPTKNCSSVREIDIDPMLAYQFRILVKDKPAGEPIFFNKKNRVFNSTINIQLGRYCKLAEVQQITLHGLRHTHASVLIASGVSVQSISRRLGHSNTSTTQNTYLHIIKELEDMDKNKAMDCLSSLCG